MLKCLRSRPERAWVHGLAFVPFVPGTVVQAVEVVQNLIGEEALRVIVVGKGIAHVGEQLEG
jgi:hypothetical protein